MENTHLPLVSIVCLSYNKAPYLAETLQSVTEQSYPHLELIVVDDKSTDGSPAIVRRFMQTYPVKAFLELPQNVGACQAFNEGLAIAEGKYIIDLAGDDILMPERVAKQVEDFERLGERYAVVFSDAWMIDGQGRKTGTFYKRNREGKLQTQVPSGDIYLPLIRKQVISSPTMMLRTSVMRELGGYDAFLSYEDYDFWVRSSRHYLYHFHAEPLTLKRVVSGSATSGFYKIGYNPHLRSTLLVCRKAWKLNRTPDENRALAVSVRYHLRMALFTHNFWTGDKFACLLRRVDGYQWHDQIWRLLLACRIKLNPVYRLYLRWRFGIGVAIAE